MSHQQPGTHTHTSYGNALDKAKKRIYDPSHLLTRLKNTEKKPWYPHRMVFLSMKLECLLPSFTFPHTSHTFSLLSSVATSITFVELAFITLPPSPLDVTAATVMICLSEGTACTAIELAMPFGTTDELELIELTELFKFSPVGVVVPSVADSWGTGPGPCVLRSSLQCGEKCRDVTCALGSSFSVEDVPR